MTSVSASSVVSSRSFFETVAECEALDQTVREYAVHALQKLDAQQAMRAEKRAAQRVERIEADRPLVEAILSLLKSSTKDTPVTASDIALSFEGQYTVQKIQSVIRLQMADKVASVDVVRDRRVVKGYFLA